MPVTRPRIALITAGVAAALTLGACSGTHDTGGGAVDHGAMTQTTGTASNATGGSGGVRADPGDVTFAQQMIPHHEQAVQMADLALGASSASPQVRDLATRIKAAQDPEIQTMTSWLDTWGAPGAGEVDHGGHAMAGMMSEDDLGALGRAWGAEFDRMWLTMMVEHHEGAVTMSRTVLESTRRAEVRTLAEAIVSAQQREIETMKGLLS